MKLTILENVRVVFLIFKLRRNSSRFVRYNSLSSVHEFSFFWYFEYNGWHSRFPLDILNTVDGIKGLFFPGYFEYSTRHSSYFIDIQNAIDGIGVVFSIFWNSIWQPSCWSFLFLVAKISCYILVPWILKVAPELSLLLVFCIQ